MNKGWRSFRYDFESLKRVRNEIREFRRERTHEAKKERSNIILDVFEGLEIEEETS